MSIAKNPTPAPERPLSEVLAIALRPAAVAIPSAGQQAVPKKKLCCDPRCPEAVVSHYNDRKNCVNYPPSFPGKREADKIMEYHKAPMPEDATIPQKSAGGATPPSKTEAEEALIAEVLWLHKYGRRLEHVSEELALQAALVAAERQQPPQP